MKLASIAMCAAVGLAWPTASSAQWLGGGSTGARERLVPAGLSLVLPGAGQHVLAQQRKWVYVALEVAGWAFFLERRHSGGEYRQRYRDYAWDRARLQGYPRVDADFEYYERLTYWSRSGAFDRDAGKVGVQPESDPDTFNGSVWERAARIFLPAGGSESDPGYASALAYYSQQAYGPDLLWDWSGSPVAQAEFSRLVDESDVRFRHATALLGVVIANHLLSSVDAYLSGGSQPAARLRFLPVEAATPRWGLELQLRVLR